MNPSLAISQPDLTYPLLVAMVVLVLSLAGLSTVFTPWLRARLARVPVPLSKLVAMRLRKVPVGLIVDAKIVATKAGVPVDTDNLEAHYLADGNVLYVVQALIMAQKANLELDWKRACAIDLATKNTGRNLLNIVKTCVETNQPVLAVFKFGQN